jgi:hypothetical protein
MFETTTEGFSHRPSDQFVVVSSLQPSFGYVITSPEKREPFPLIHPSDFLSQDSSVHNDTLTHTDHDRTMNTGTNRLDVPDTCLILTVRPGSKTLIPDSHCEARQ